MLRNWSDFSHVSSFHFALTQRLKFHSERRRHSLDFLHKHFDHWSSRACGEVDPACTLVSWNRAVPTNSKKIKPIGIMGLLQFGVLATFYGRSFVQNCAHLFQQKDILALWILYHQDIKVCINKVRETSGILNNPKFKRAYRIYSELYCQLSSCCSLTFQCVAVVLRLRRLNGPMWGDGRARADRCWEPRGNFLTCDPWQQTLILQMRAWSRRLQLFQG